jgi:hypothetical protein
MESPLSYVVRFESSEFPSARRDSDPTAARLRALALLAQLVEHLHGKEGVNGSSPLEGFTKSPQINSFWL